MKFGLRASFYLSREKELGKKKKKNTEESAKKTQITIEAVSAGIG